MTAAPADLPDLHSVPAPSQVQPQARTRWLRAGRPALHRLLRSRLRALTVFGAVTVAMTGLSSGLAVIIEKG